MMGKESFLHNIVYSGANKKTADYCFTILNKTIVEIKTEYSKDVFAICIDKEAKMVVIRELVMKKYPAMLTWMQFSLYEFAGKRYWQHCCLKVDYERSISEMSTLPMDC